MTESKNRFITLLVTINIVAFIIIFILMWLLWKDNTVMRQDNNFANNDIDSMTSSQSEEEKPALAEQPATSLTRQTVSVIDKVINEVKVTDFNLDNYLGDDESLDETITSSKEKTSDSDYLAAYAQLNKAVKTADIDFDENTITTVTASDADETQIDHFNRVDVSNSERTADDDNASLANLVAEIVNNEDQQEDKKTETPAWKDYLESLKPAEAERKNEVRTITVRQGETLWRIAVRAYGNGFLYKKIFEANPHLTSPNAITAGEVLRVPL